MHVSIQLVTVLNYYKEQQETEMRYRQRSIFMRYRLLKNVINVEKDDIMDNFSGQLKISPENPNHEIY